MALVIRRTLVLSLLVGSVAAVGPVADAGATDATIVATVKRDAPKITRSQAKVLDGLATFEKNNSTTALVAAIKAQDATLTAFKHSLSVEKSTTAKVSRGKADIIRGLGMIIASNKARPKTWRRRLRVRRSPSPSCRRL